jgi:methylated-DNA-[protein]-cysteine S-methyltransferase
MTDEPASDLEQRLRHAAAAPPADTWAGARARLAERADADGLVDIAYAWTDSPVGALLIAATPAGLARIAFDTEPAEAVLAELAARVSPRVLEAPGRLDAARRQLDEYFHRGRTSFDLGLDWSLAAGFRRQVLAATAAIPYGHTETYSSLAEAAGNPRATRAAGSALATNPIPIVVPCHRVTRADGGLGGYRGGPTRKHALLSHERDTARTERT